MVYLADVIVFGATFHETLENLKLVFKRFKSANLKLKPKKCCLFMDEVCYLGYVVSEEGINCDPKKIDAVRNWPTPTDLTSLRSFLGLASYYRQFIENFSSIAYALTRLTQKNVKFILTGNCNYAFNNLKDKLATAPILAYPTQIERFILDTRVSGYGIGGVISSYGMEKRGL